MFIKLHLVFLLILYIECSQIKLLYSSTPAYLGTTKPVLLDCDHFTRYHYCFYSPSVPNSFEKLNDDMMLLIFEYLRNDNFYLFPHLIYSCKRFCRLLTKSFLSRFNLQSPQLFLALPPKFRLTFALKYLWDFEELFSIGIDRKLSREEVSGLVFVALHLRNQLYISPEDLKFAESIKNGTLKRRLSDSITNILSINTSNVLHQRFPYSSPTSWRSSLLSYFINNSIYFAIESICRFDPSTIYWTIDLVLLRHRLEVDEKDLMLLRSVLDISNDKDTLKYLLNQSINFQNISVFNEFLSLWTDPIALLNENNPNNVINLTTNNQHHNEMPHVLLRMAYNGLSLPSLLDLEEIRQDQLLLAASLKECENAGNYQLATDLITKFPSQSFSNLYDFHLIDLLRQVITSQRHDGVNLPRNTQKTLAMLLASFHFPQPEILETFRRLIRSWRISKAFLEELSRKKTLLYYNNVHSNRHICTIS